MALKALIFDVDGTLADTERDGHRPAFNAAFEEYGLDWYWDEALYGELLAVTGGKERICHFVRQYLPANRRPADPETIAAELHPIKTGHYTRLLSEGRIPLRPGVRRLLTEARSAGLRLAIATTTTPANVSALLHYSLEPGAEAWFDVIAAGDIVPAKKPAPDIYRWALQKLELPPQACLAFEDSGNGIRSSLASGIPTLVTVNDYTGEDDFSGALLVLSDLGEPDAPFRVLRGDAGSHRMVDLKLLQTLRG